MTKKKRICVTLNLNNYTRYRVKCAEQLKSVSNGLDELIASDLKEGK